MLNENIPFASVSIKGWSELGFDSTKWIPAVDVMAPESYSSPVYSSNLGTEITVVKTLTVVSYTEPRSGVFVYDMGVNMVGEPCVEMKNLSAGQPVTFRTGEVLYPDLPEYRDINGSSMVEMIFTENFRGALSTDIYIAKCSRTEKFQPTLMDIDIWKLLV